MFGPVGRPTAASSHRPRRRVALVAIAAVLVAIVLATLIDQLVNSYRPAERRSALSWEASVAPIIAGSTSLGRVLGTFRSSAPSESRATLDATLSALVLGTREELTSAAEIGIAPPSSRAAALVRTTLADRVDAVQSLAGAIELATGPAQDTGLAATRLVAVGNDLGQGDRAWAELRRMLRSQGTDLLPDSTWLSDRSAFAPGPVAQFAADLAAVPRLADRSRLQIVAISVDPAPDRIEGLPTTTSVPPVRATTTALAPSGAVGSVVTTSSTTTTLPPTTTTTLAIPPVGSLSYLLPTPTVTVSTVVANAGDVVLGSVTVTATLTVSGSGATATPEQVRAKVATLAPGGSVYFSLAPMRVPKNRTCLLRITVTGVGAGEASDTVTLVTSR